MRLFILLLFIFSITQSVAQVQPAGMPTRAELEKRKQQLMDEIESYKRELANTNKDKNATLAQLRILQEKLNSRKKLIGNINQELGSITNSIATSSHEVSSLQQQLNIQKARYAQSVRYAYANRSSYNMMAFIFSSSDFNDAIRRLKYLKKYRDYREQQAVLIRKTQIKLHEKIDDLNVIKSEKDKLLMAEVQQKRELEAETNETNKVVKDLKGREKELTAQIEKKQRQTRQLNTAISNIIQREIEIARKKAEEEQKKQVAKSNATSKPNTGGTANVEPYKPKPVSNSYISNLTPSEAALSDNFEANRGRLPWPVEKGFISESFGTHKHPIAEKVLVENFGVDIKTNANAPARAVFDGVVSSVFSAGMGQTVMINHGKFFTVYSKLGAVSVKAGDRVKTKQHIGVVGNIDGETTINFQIWKVGTNNKSARVNPEDWIAR
ncbi:MAG: murein hydrolase activator EnvC family protein [Bacteroidota bacterium]